MNSTRTSRCTSLGVDGITYSMLKYLPISAKLFFCSAHNKIIHYGENADCIKSIIAIGINKPGKYHEFRPITLMSCLMKTHGRIKVIFEPGEYEFRRSKGVSDCIIWLRDFTRALVIHGNLDANELMPLCLNL